MIILSDNQYISKAGIRYVLQEMEMKCAIGEAEAKCKLIALLDENPVATVILDFTNFDFNNVEDLLIVASRFPQARWLLFSDELSIAFLKRISLEKNFGILLKNANYEEITQAIVQTLNGEKYFCEQISQLLYSQDVHSPEKQILTNSENEILKLIAFGKSVKEIADERFSSIHTIVAHKKNIFRKLEVNNVYEATKYALRSGLIDEMEYFI
ncbi:MAG: response regulator transcription factor [Paludibacter sp.]|jgi:DNA-binding NarL/FixJ family response regulator|nr:response regulator transcription factor [Paludibacter sp.]